MTIKSPIKSMIEAKRSDNPSSLKAKSSPKIGIKLQDCIKLPPSKGMEKFKYTSTIEAIVIRPALQAEATRFILADQPTNPAPINGNKTAKGKTYDINISQLALFFTLSYNKLHKRAIIELLCDKMVIKQGLIDLFLSKISYFIELLNRIFGYLTALLVLLLAFLVFYDTTMRYLFQSGSISLQELEWHLFSAIFLLALGYTHKHQKHVRVDIFFENYPKKAKATFEIISNIFVIIPFSAVVIYFSWEFVALSFGMSEGSPSGGLCCRYVIKSLIIVGFSLLILQSLSEVIKNIEKLRT